MGLWPLLAAVLVVGLAVLFALMLAHQRRRIRYLLRNRLTPLSVLNEEPTPVQRGLPLAIVGVVVVIALAVLAFAYRREETMAGTHGTEARLTRDSIPVEGHAMPCRRCCYRPSSP